MHCNSRLLDLRDASQFLRPHYHFRNYSSCLNEKGQCNKVPVANLKHLGASGVMRAQGCTTSLAVSQLTTRGWRALSLSSRANSVPAAKATTMYLGRQEAAVQINIIEMPWEKKNLMSERCSRMHPVIFMYELLHLPSLQLLQLLGSAVELNLCLVFHHI